MPSDIIASVLGGLTDGVVGAALGFLFAYILFRIQRQQKIIEYSVLSMPLLRFKPTATSPLSVSVDKSILTNDSVDKGVPEQIRSAYGFEIELLNAGNEPVVQPTIEIQLDQAAKIVEYETNPPNRTGYDISIERDQRKANVLRVQVPFINSGHRLSVRVISTENRGPRCQVDVLGVGVHTRDADADSRRFVALAQLTLIAFLGFAAVLLMTGDTWLPSPAIAALGGHIENKPQAVFPWWLQSVVVVAWYVMLMVYTIKFLKVTVLRSMQKVGRDWDWRAPTTKQSTLRKLMFRIFDIK